jgi:hypothetical protein
MGEMQDPKLGKVGICPSIWSHISSLVLTIIAYLLTVYANPTHHTRS